VSAARKAFLTIGQVLGELDREFPDLTISKIRFLEDEGLLQPERTAAGYRKFSREDVARLRYILTCQRDHFHPLRVIKDNLDSLDRGLEPTAGGPPTGQGPAPRQPRALAAVRALPSPDDFLPDVATLRLSREELLQTAGITVQTLVELERIGLLGPVHGTRHYDGVALDVATTVVALSGYGLEPRHLGGFRAAVDRHSGLIDQVVTPHARARTPEARAKAQEMSRELAAHLVSLYANLVKAKLTSTS
jgi:DNA-binding transcriptional MerR regulator